jgi:hypothetical protein
LTLPYFSIHTKRNFTLPNFTTHSKRKRIGEEEKEEKYTILVEVDEEEKDSEDSDDEAERAEIEAERTKMPRISYKTLIPLSKPINFLGVGAKIIFRIINFDGVDVPLTVPNHSPKVEGE